MSLLRIRRNFALSCYSCAHIPKYSDMFSLPQAKRVRREELYSPTSSTHSSPDLELDKLFRDRIHLEFSAVTETENNGDIVDNTKASDHEDEVEFRLFAPSAKADKTARATKIRIRSPSVDERPPGLIHPERARNYYFRDSLSPEAEEKIRKAAVSGDEVVARSRTPCPGAVLPWRVTTIAVTGASTPLSTHILSVHSDTARKKKRKGKKSRIAIRQNNAEKRAKLEKEEQAAAEKAHTDKVKKAKRNREKKFKKRARDKLKANLVSGESVNTGVTAKAADSSDEEESD